MNLPRSVAEGLDDHVTFELECIDRVHLNLYQPKLVYTAGVVASSSITGRDALRLRP